MNILLYGVRRESEAATRLWYLLKWIPAPKQCRASIAAALQRANALFVSICALCIGLTGCKTFRPVEDLTRYYILMPSAVAPTTTVSNRNLTIGIAPIEIPPYLVNNRVAVRRGTNEIHYSEYRQWAEHLDKGIQRVLAADLSVLAPGTKTISAAWQSSDVKAEVHVSIHRFELDESGQVTLECEWRIKSPQGQAIYADRTFISRKGPSLASNPAAAVNTLGEAIGELSGNIAARLPFM